jgi:hypothetical protein
MIEHRRLVREALVLCVVWCCSALPSQAFAQEQNLHDIPTDLTVPSVTLDTAAAGRRVSAVTSGWESTSVHHTLYLAADWTPDKSWPVLVEYPGNGGFRNDLGDTSDGTVEGCVLGYGLSGGKGFLWICLPFVEIAPDTARRNCATWWGDIAETKRYCQATVTEVCTKYNGDPSRVVLCGFSRGAIACNYIGLHDDEIAQIWRAFFCHSHYDGVRRWPYSESDPASALTRLQRLQNREQWISHENSIDATRSYLGHQGVEAPFKLVPIPYPNHSAAWVLRDIPERQQAREWLMRVTRPTP